MISRRPLPILLALLAASCGHPAAPRKLSIAAAADLQFALADAARQFHLQHPETELAIDYGSSGNFDAQIRNGAPFDLFLSADVQYPRNLARDGLARADSLFVYAAGRLAVWVPASSPLDPATALRDPRCAASPSPTPGTHPMAAPRKRPSHTWASTRASKRNSCWEKISRRRCNSCRAARPTPESWRSPWRWLPRCAARGDTGRFRWSRIRKWSRAASF
jgi:hypothetical protein